MTSVWEKTAALPSFPPLSGDTKVDVAIIGGGITGILCAYLLSNANVRCALIEKDRICGGVTGKTTAKLTVQHGLIYDKLLRQFGLEQTKMYLAANQAALERYRALCGQIDCDYTQLSAYVYSRDDPRKIEKELQAMKQLGYSAALAQNLPLPFSIAGAIRFDGQAQFHPLKFLASIVPGLPVYEHTKALELWPGAVRTDRGTVQAEHIIVATHFPILNKHGSYFLKLYQERSYVLALDNAPDLHGLYIDAASGGLSFRNAENCLLLGGNAHRTGKQSTGWKPLTDFAAKHYPDSREVTRWATQDCMSLDGVPYIGHYSANTTGLWVATGYNKWGMTSAMAAATILTGAITGKPLPYAPVFSPSRTVLRPQLACNAAHSLINLLTPTKPRCPHLGCALKYNPQEHTWDCPCHGSRFTEDGILLDGPATGDLPGS